MSSEQISNKVGDDLAAKRAAILGGIVVCLGLCVIIVDYIMEAPAKASLQYVPTVTKGKVTESFVIGESRARSKYCFVQYAYQVSGKTYSSNRIGYPPVTVESDVRRYPKGTEVQVFYDALRPSQACLVRGSLRPSESQFAQTAGWIVVVLGFLLTSYIFSVARKQDSSDPT